LEGVERLMSKIHSKRVPATGPIDAKIMLVGEAPGREEESQGEPFVGRSGELLTRYLSRLGLSRSDVRLENLCKYRPSGNKFHYLLDSEELEIGLEELRESIRTGKPNVIVAMGNWPLHFLTGIGNRRGNNATGIAKVRGTITECVLHDEYKVLPTYHPAYIIRPQGFRWNPVFYADLEKAKKESAYREIREPEFESIIDPPADIMENIVDEMCAAEWLAIDIETFEGNVMSCFGVADSEKRGLCITYKHESGWHHVERILASPAKKIFQFGSFDVMFLHRFYGFKTSNYAFDTFIAAASLMPSFPRGLDFLSSIYTNFKYYKEERKIWKEGGDMMTLWEYNIKDVIATYIIAMKQMKELKEDWA
jgi:uracil-DNA glycosylase